MSTTTEDGCIVALRALTALLEDPQPGLSTWHQACESVSRKVEEEIKKARGQGLRNPDMQHSTKGYTAADKAKEPKHLTADEQMTRDAILDVLDGGPPGREVWNLYEDHGSEGAQTEDGANADRLDFCSAVINRARQLKTQDDNEKARQMLEREVGLLEESFHA